jgi:hypothetical protein
MMVGYIPTLFVAEPTMKRLLGILLVTVALAAPQAQAGMIGTDQAAQPQAERERVKALLERPEVAKGLEKMGVAPKDAAARIDAMSDAEVIQLAGRIDSLPAGGVLSNQELLLIIIIVLLVALLL